MTLTLTEPTTTGTGTDLGPVAARARDYAANSKADATWRAYRSDWSCFESWCAARGLEPLPATGETVALYIADLAQTRKPATIQRRLSTITQRHRLAGFDSPARTVEVAATWAGIRRELGTAQRRVDPITTGVLRELVEVLPGRLIGTRDRALLLLGFAGAFRRSELVALNVEDVTDVPEGLRVTLRRSKTDQDGAGAVVAIPYGSRPDTCPVRALRAWLEAAGVESGPVFRPVDRHGAVGASRLSDRAVAEVIKRTCRRAGLDPARFSGHSLRAGFATAAGEAGVAERHIARQTRHRSMSMLRRYIREGDMWRDNAASEVGL